VLLPEEVIIPFPAAVPTATFCVPLCNEYNEYVPIATVSDAALMIAPNELAPIATTPDTVLFKLAPAPYPTPVHLDAVDVFTPPMQTLLFAITDNPFATTFPVNVFVAAFLSGMFDDNALSAIDVLGRVIVPADTVNPPEKVIKLDMVLAELVNTTFADSALSAIDVLGRVIVPADTVRPPEKVIKLDMVLAELVNTTFDDK
jgi:hypothetical protein